MYWICFPAQLEVTLSIAMYAQSFLRNENNLALKRSVIVLQLRDAQYKVEELNSQNQNLQTRIKTLKQERIDSIISGKS